MLALKHRQNKSQRQRVVVFAGSPVSEDEETLVRLGKKLKKNNVAVDVVAFANIEENEAKLQARCRDALSSRCETQLTRLRSAPGVRECGEQQQQQQPGHRAARRAGAVRRAHRVRDPNRPNSPVQ